MQRRSAMPTQSFHGRVRLPELAQSGPPGMSAIRSLSGEQRTLRKRAQYARFICALATPLSADFLPRSGLVQFIIYDVIELLALNGQTNWDRVCRLLEQQRTKGGARAEFVGSD